MGVREFAQPETLGVSDDGVSLEQKSYQCFHSGQPMALQGLRAITWSTDEALIMSRSGEATCPVGSQYPRGKISLSLVRLIAVGERTFQAGRVVD